jgi:multiple sugar transport system permease protein
MKKRISLNKSAFLSKILFWGVIGLLAFLTLFPLYYLLLTSLKSPLLILRQPPLFLFKPSFSNYYRLFIESGYGYYFVNSFIISLFSTVIALIIGTLGAFAFAKFKFWLDRTLFLLQISTSFFSIYDRFYPNFFSLFR